MYHNIYSYLIGYYFTDRVRNKPEFITGYPANITAHEGESVALQCLLASDTPPHVQVYNLRYI